MSHEHEQTGHAPNRTRLNGLRGKRYWRSLDELARTPEFAEFLQREFPQAASEWHDPVSRRSFMKLMAASIALAGLTGCGDREQSKIVPYIVPPEQVVSTKPLFFASAMPWHGYGRGVLVESHMGRPTKIEGNPEHPASLGSTDAITQASVLTEWDPDRAKTVTAGGEVSGWESFVQAWQKEIPNLQKNRGRGLRILTETITSPTLADQIQQLLKQYPEARWHQYDPVGREGARRGAEMAFGRDVNTIYHFEKAERVLSLDSDFLLELPGSLRYARDFIEKRRIRAPHDKEGQPTGMEKLSMNRLYAIQSTPTITGAMADHRLSVKASAVGSIARQIAERLGVAGAKGAPPLAPEMVQWVDAMVRDLQQHKGSSLVVAGAFQSPMVHALAHAMNQTLGNAGKTVTYTDPIEAGGGERGGTLADLVRDMTAGQVDTLVILGANPIFTAPADLDLKQAMLKVRLRIHQSLYYDETSYYAHWHIPEAHYLETWGDIRAHDGTVSIIQPLIAPLYQGKSPIELVAALGGHTQPSALAIVQERWRPKAGDDFNRFWNDSVRKGIVEKTAQGPVEVTVRQDFLGQGGNSQTQPATEGLEIVFRPDPHLWDGRYANNGWLQELPKPLLRLTWDNPALISPATARRLGIKSERMVRLKHQGRELEVAVWVTPGHPDDAITLFLGGGREQAGRVGTKTEESGGFNVYRIRTSQQPWVATGVEITPLKQEYPLACVQGHQLLDDPSEDQVRVQTIQEFSEEMKQTPEKHRTHHLSLYPAWDYSKGHQWAMEIDTNACIGCNACVIACQAENNIPIVGKKEVLNAREMHWIRIDTYYEGDPEKTPDPFFEPVPCMHCETAPCEVVCPVGATTHSAEGLNEMTYNRCVGTRYCSNNCPYKVRRFNFFRYADNRTPSRQLGYNPDVTVRARGVMEKCTYCVQRLNHTRIDIKQLQVALDKAASPQEKAEVQKQIDQAMGTLDTACAQACPTKAIVFGDLNYMRPGKDGQREKSEVRKLREQPQDFGLLTYLNTRPRTGYLPRFRNPNPEMEKH